mmetsp:Transcript_60354/g.140581  ORF Transcript_60354/g.140581 Transcript_60354/m.140581 type:complete len:246 (+) Transcript_60354:192-929(+)
MVCYLATQCCCGCSLTFGVKAILITNLVRNLGTVALVTLSLVFKNHALQFSQSLFRQTCLGAFALAGIPLVVAGLWGVYNKVEAPLRIYFYYLIAALMVDIGFVVYALVLENPCLSLPGIVKGEGQAFACGMARVSNFIATFTAMAVSFYLAFIIFSYCEDLAMGGGADLADLAVQRHAHKTKISALGRHRLVGDLTHFYQPSEYGSVMTAAQMEDDYGSTPLWGSHHQMEYPPPNAPYRNMGQM